MFIHRIFLHIEQSYANPRERNDSPSTDQSDYRQNGTRYPLNGSSGQVGLFLRWQVSYVAKCIFP